MAVNRKGFFKRSAAVGGCCGAALLAGSMLDLGAESAFGQSPAATPQEPLTPLDKRVEQGQQVIMRLVARMDERLDKPTRDGLMAACGAACFLASRPAQAKPTAEEAAKNLERIRQWVGASNVIQGDRETLVRMEFTQNPRGLKTADGHCLCPIFENAPKGVSATYCECSRGYVQQMFATMLGRTATVELQASVLRGDRTCKFEVRMPTEA